VGLIPSVLASLPLYPRCSVRHTKVEHEMCVTTTVSWIYIEASSLSVEEVSFGIYSTLSHWNWLSFYRGPLGVVESLECLIVTILLVIALFRWNLRLL